jgi:hypothetical protein
MTANLFEGCGAKDKPDLRKPLQWAESLLIFLLKTRDRETIPGDLLEEYREDRLPMLGHVRADFWYVRQVFGIACFQPFEGGPMKGILLFLCFFTLAAMTWLGIMEMILHHPGSSLRICMAILLACQSLSTILFLMFRGHGRVQLLLRISGGLIAIFGISAIVSILKAAHFEGYVLLIGLALILQGALTVAAPALRGGDKIGGHLPESPLTP